MNRPVYVYGLINPETSVIHYVGVAYNPYERYKEHLRPFSLKSVSLKNSWIKSLLAKGITPKLCALGKTDEAGSAELEKFWISNVRRLWPEANKNMTDGGDGIPGHTHSVKTKSKMRATALTITHTPASETAWERFLSKIVPADNGLCLLWTGATNDAGYGQLSMGRSKIKKEQSLAVYVHRYAYEELVGPIPQHYIVRQLCQNILCVNPDHLYLKLKIKRLRKRTR